MRTIMSNGALTITALVLTLGTVGSGVAQTVYRVVGPDGRVTYTNETPAPHAGAVSIVDVDRGVVVPALARPATATPHAATAPSTDAPLREALTRQQIETERARQQAYEADAARHRAEAERLAAAQAACERDGWTNCNDEPWLIDRGWLVRPAPHRHRSPPRVDPTPVTPTAPVHALEPRH